MMAKINLIIGAIAFAVVLFFFQENKILKKEIESKDILLKLNQKAVLMIKDKEKQAIDAIGLKEAEIKRITKERRENEDKFNQKASSHYHQWRVHRLPDDIVNRMQKQ